MFQPDLFSLFLDESAAEAGLTLLRVSRPAMGTRFEIAFPAGTLNAVAAAEDALDLIDEIEDELTVYRDTSELSRVNAEAADAPVVVSPRVFDILRQCQALTVETSGAYDAASGSLVKAWGFLQRAGQMPTPAELAAARASSGFRHVILDESVRSIRYLRRGLSINLGGIGKGYAIDLAAQLLRTRWGIRSAILHGGGSSVRAIGRPPAMPRGWPIALLHPSEPGVILATVHLMDRAMGTSAATFQFFEYNGKKYGHLIDPRTGCPAEGTASATCLAPSAALADALSTAFFVRGSDWTAEYVRTRSDLAAVVLDENSEIIRTMNLDSASRKGLEMSESQVKNVTEMSSPAHSPNI